MFIDAFASSEIGEEGNCSVHVYSGSVGVKCTDISEIGEEGNCSVHVYSGSVEVKCTDISEIGKEGNCSVYSGSVGVKCTDMCNVSEIGEEGNCSVSSGSVGVKCTDIYISDRTYNVNSNTGRRYCCEGGHWKQLPKDDIVSSNYDIEETPRSHGLPKNGGQGCTTGLCDVENAGSFHRCDCLNEEETIEMPPVMKYFVAPYERTPEVY
ncbi:hypothetical protein EMCRGX_G012849 [Ephydatia muelleri]